MADEFDAIKRYIPMILPVETQFGEVVSVGLISALVSINGGTPQEADIAPNVTIGKGDTVFMVRPRRASARWAVAQAIVRRSKGVSANNQPNVGKNIGERAWAVPFTTNPSSTYHDISSSTKAKVLEIVKVFSGGSALVVVNGYAAPTGSAGTFTLGISIGENYTETYRHYMATTNTYSICHTYAGGLPLYGEQHIYLWAAASTGTIRMTATAFSVLEV